ncbi:leucine-rich repeat domain-containing protein [Spirochaeta cellobiosiphila]|uniref:leucine-rich repeat domain-containing protein n=1 Tax=Spirochaeta cellobiosiphila TaxID=504483 RepID=UPI0003F7912C|nr:leucine-rich repeat domain-containing protein [Spirochaeta cellobiosiphila]
MYIKKIMSLVRLISLSLIVSSCNLFNTEPKPHDGEPEDLKPYGISLSANSVFFKDDILSYHKGSFVVTERATQESLENPNQYISVFDTHQVGKGLVVFVINDISYNYPIDIRDNNIVYKINSDNQIIMSEMGTIDSNYVVPRTIKGLPVVGIEWPGFYENKNVRNVSLPEGLQSLGQGVFESSALEKINLPESLSKIGQATFAGSSLSSITLPSHIKEIPEASFNDTKITSIYIPDNIEKIGPKSFLRSELQTVEFETGPEEIGESAFSQNHINNIYIPSGTQIIGKYAFSSNPHERIVVKGKKDIGEKAFQLSDHDVEVDIDESYTEKTELERIFGVEPLSINGVHKDPIYTSEEVRIFKNWAGKQINIIRKEHDGNIEYGLETLKATIYSSILSIRLEYYRGINDVHYFEVQKDDDIYTYKEYKDDILIAEDTDTDMVNLLSDR